MTLMFAATSPADDVPFTITTADPFGTDAPGNVSFSPFCDIPAFKVPIETGIFVVVLIPFSVEELSIMPVTVVEPELRTLNWTVTTLLFLLTARETVTVSMMTEPTLTEMLLVLDAP